MTMAELERWLSLEIAGKYHQNVHRGVHAIPAQLWDRSIRVAPPPLVKDPERFVIDCLPAETRQVGRNGFQINRIRYWGTHCSQGFSQVHAFLSATTQGIYRRSMSPPRPMPSISPFRTRTVVR
jgi:hypothetical protein